MPPTKDLIHEYRGYHTPGVVCRVRIYERPGAAPVIVATELPENQNTSITNMAEYLAAEVSARYLPGVLDSDQIRPFIWIEHYSPSGGPTEAARNMTSSRSLTTGHGSALRPASGESRSAHRPGDLSRAPRSSS